MMEFEKVFLPMVLNSECINKNERLVESKEILMKEGLEEVVKANMEANKMLAIIEKEK